MDFACGLRGLIYVPLNWRLSKEELTNILADATPSFLIYDEEMECPITLENMQSTQFQCKKTASPTIRPMDLNDPLLMIYTGGTTGKAMGVVLSYNSINWNAINTITS